MDQELVTHVGLGLFVMSSEVETSLTIRRLGSKAK